MEQIREEPNKHGTSTAQSSSISRTHHRDRITRVWRHQWCRNSCRGVCGSLATLRDKPRFTSSEVQSGKKGVNDTKIGAGVGAHGLKSHGKRERRPLQDQPIRSVCGWLDSTVALHWIKGGGSIYKQFVANRVSKIRGKDYITWRHVNTDQNPADVGSRGCDGAKLPNLWLKGPEWLASPESWPAEILTEPSKETEAEAKLTKEVLGTIAETKDDLDEILNKHSFWRQCE